MTELDELRLAAWRAFLYAHAAVIEAIERDLATAGAVPLGTYDVLVALHEAPEGRLRMSDLARRIVLNRSTLTRRVDRLEAEALLRRERCGRDRRATYAVLTEAGAAALRRAWPIYARGIAAYFGRHLSDTEAAVLAEALARVQAAAPGAP